jgi:hypothetical protein
LMVFIFSQSDENRRFEPIVGENKPLAKFEPYVAKRGHHASGGN